jgi:phage I-like protein
MACRTADGDAVLVPEQVAGRVVLAANDYEALLATQPKDGEVVMAKVEVDSIKARATAAEAKLFANEVAQILDAAQGEGRILPAERDNLTKLAQADMDLFRAMVAGRPQIVRMTEAGSDEQTGAPVGTDVGPWVAARAQELMAAGALAGKAMSLATREAAQKFPASAFDVWRYGEGRQAEEAAEAAQE